MANKKATRESYGEALALLADENKDVVVLDADLSKSTKTELFQKKAPDRFFDCGIAEGNMIGIAAGFAAGKFHLHHLLPCLLRDVHLNRFEILWGILISTLKFVQPMQAFLWEKMGLHISAARTLD